MCIYWNETYLVDECDRILFFTQGNYKVKGPLIVLSREKQRCKGEILFVSLFFSSSFFFFFFFFVMLYT